MNDGDVLDVQFYEMTYVRSRLYPGPPRGEYQDLLVSADPIVPISHRDSFLRSMLSCDLSVFSTSGSLPRLCQYRSPT